MPVCMNPSGRYLPGLCKFTHVHFFGFKCCAAHQGVEWLHASMLASCSSLAFLQLCCFVCSLYAVQYHYSEDSICRPTKSLHRLCCMAGGCCCRCVMPLWKPPGSMKPAPGRAFCLPQHLLMRQQQVTHVAAAAPLEAWQHAAAALAAATAATPPLQQHQAVSAVQVVPLLLSPLLLLLAPAAGAMGAL